MALRIDKMIDKNSDDLLMSGRESLECEAPASLLIFQETGRIVRSNAKRRRGAAVQSQA
jgi:hypothetical protein